MAAARDLRLLYAGRALRAFGFGFSAILIAVHLQSRGLTPSGIGLVLAVALASGSLTGLLSALAANRFGRRRTLAVIGVLMALCGVDLALAHPGWLLGLAGVSGMLGAASVDMGPFLAVEQAILAQLSDPERRNRAFARYSFTGALAGSAGGLASGLGTSASRTSQFFFLFALLGLGTTLLSSLLSERAEGESSAPVFGSLRPIVGLSALFALDSLGGGLVVNAVVVYWLHVRFGAGPSVLGPSFAAMSLLNAVSLELAGRMADRFGLVNTMVFTHLPSSLILVLVPFMPSLGLAIAVLVLRSTVVAMDQPTRQAYIVSIVKPSERSGALAVTGAVRGVAQAAGPIITGAAIQSAALGIPFFAGAAIKSVYDIALWAGFRSRPGDHERR